jgi:hypothetical protein
MPPAQKHTLHTDRLAVLRTGARPAEALAAAGSAQLGCLQLEACGSSDFVAVHEASCSALAQLRSGATLELARSACSGEAETLLTFEPRRASSARTHAFSMRLPSDGPACLQLRTSQRRGRVATHAAVRVDATGGVQLTRELLAHAVNRGGALADGGGAEADLHRRNASAGERRAAESRLLLRHTLRGCSELAANGALPFGKAALLRCSARAVTQAPVESSISVRGCTCLATDPKGSFVCKAEA